MYRRGRRPMGLFPLGGLFILPALMFGGWIVLAVLGGILGLAGSIISEVFGGLSFLASEAFTGAGLVAGIVIGILVFCGLKKKKEAAREENTGTVDGVEVETQIVEPQTQYRQMN